MKDQLLQCIALAVQQLKDEGVLPTDFAPTIQIDTARDKAHGDFATNVALVAAKVAGMPPRALAEKLLSKIPTTGFISKTEIAGPGFINFFVAAESTFEVVEKALTEGSAFGRSKHGAGQKVQVEFVSANPTGPLHVGHGRGAAYGATVADLLDWAGFEVEREYYINDAGRQMNILAASVWLRYLELCGEGFRFPSNGYRGDYVVDVSRQLLESDGKAFHHASSVVFSDLPLDEPDGGDKEEYIDAVVSRCRALLGEAGYRKVFDLGLNGILDDIRDDLSQFGVSYQNWFSERSIADAIPKALAILEERGHLYEKDGALWFQSTSFGDDKDRVLKRDNGEMTYFASDIAYHLNKYERGYDAIVNVWGADHHGYIARVKAALQALGLEAERLTVRLVQFAILYRGGERVQMSTRSGSFVTLRELRDEVGNDAARFFYVTRKSEQHMDFDLDLAKSESKDNPVYYIQYAHARVCSVMRKLADSSDAWSQERALAALDQLVLEEEKDIAVQLMRFPELIRTAATQYEPHLLTYYLKDLASTFHTYYNSHRVLVDDLALRDARLALSLSVKQVIANGLQILGVSAPEEM